jgi:aminotransferase in exopolysaccharide biosynthesis
MKNLDTNSPIEQQILAAISKVVGKGPVALHEPTFDGNEWVYLKECLDSTYVSSVGAFVDQFELEIAKFTGSKYAVSVVNGTAGLHIALKLSGVKDNDEVLVPALTFVATANAVTYCNAVPHFVDSEENTLGMDAEKLREYLKDITKQENGFCVNISTGRIIRAMIPMHTFGHPANIEGLLSISNEFNIVLVEDAAESIGSYYFGQHTGTFGLFGVISFNGNKTITTGGGGVILTSNAPLARHAKHLTTTARIPHSWEFIHDEIAYNYRMPNINAALGCAQLEQLTSKIEAKRRLFDAYDKVFKDIKPLQLVKEPANCKSNYWLQTIKLSCPSIKLRNKILDVTNAAGYMTRPTWALLSDLDQFKFSPKSDLSVSKELFSSLINIPSSDKLQSRNLML